MSARRYAAVRVVRRCTENGKHEDRLWQRLNRGHLSAVAVAHASVGDVALGGGEVLATGLAVVDGVAFGVAPVRGVDEEVRVSDAEVELLAHHLD